MEFWAVGIFIVLAGILLAGYRWAQDDSDVTENSDQNLNANTENGQQQEQQERPEIKRAA